MENSTPGLVLLVQFFFVRYVLRTYISINQMDLFNAVNYKNCY